LGAAKGASRVARSAVAFGLPVARAIAFHGWLNWVRFGTSLESGSRTIKLGDDLP